MCIRDRYITADLSREDEINALWSQVGILDILVNNAGIWPTAYVADMTSGSFRKTLDINLIAPFLLTRNFVNQCLSNSKKGKIVNMVSQAAFHGSTSGHAHYAASKAGLVAFTVSLAREVAPNGINVNAVAPGMMRTPMNKEALEDREDEYLKRIPLRRVADPSEVAAAVVYPVSYTHLPAVRRRPHRLGFHPWHFAPEFSENPCPFSSSALLFVMFPY